MTRKAFFFCAFSIATRHTLIGVCDSSRNADVEITFPLLLNVIPALVLGFLTHRRHV